MIISNQETSINAFCDASFASFASPADGKSHTGYIIHIGTSYLCSKSSKQRVGSRSSTDSEIIAAADCLEVVQWLTDIISDLPITKF
jgi:hypothetical protein